MPSLLTLLLGVADDFDGFGGTSLELVAWELGLEPDAVGDVWDRAVERGLLEPADTDRIFGESMFRLTPAGRAALATPHSVPATDHGTVVPLAGVRGRAPRVSTGHSRTHDAGRSVRRVSS